MEEEHKQYVKNEKTRADVLEYDADMNEDVDLNKDKTTTREYEVKVIDKTSRSSSFREKMGGLSPHRCPLKDRMTDKRFHILIRFN